MASTNRWETVGTKKNKTQTQSKAQKKLAAENMPRLNQSVPLKESSTIYDAFIEKNQSAPKSNKDSSGSGKESVKKPQHSKKKKTASNEKKKEVAVLADIVKELDVKQLETVLVKDQETFPDSPLVWLKDLASLISLKLEPVAEPDPVYSDKPLDYPACHVSKPVKKLLLNSLHQCSTHTLEIFLEHSVQAIINDISKGMPTYGYRIFAQLLCHDKPHIAVSFLHKYLDMLKANQNRPVRCLSIMWVVGQAGVKDFSAGLKVWLELMWPMMGVRALSPYAVEYLEQLFRLHKDVKTGYDVITFREFFPILDLVFAQKANIPANLQKRLHTLYPKIKGISFTNQPSVKMRNFFPSFLSRCTSQCTKNLRSELLNCLVTCLSSDTQCFSLWRQMYLKHMEQSGVLLRHLIDKWDSLSARFDRKELKDTVQAFNITNEEMATKGNAATGESHAPCVSGCKELLVKMNKSRFPWKLLFIMLFSAIAGVAAYDFYIHDGFKDSQTCKFLTNSGILMFLEQLWGRLKMYSGKALMWLEKNVPFYYSKACEFAGPYFRLLWEKLYEVGVYIVEVTEPLRAWLNIKVPLLLEWIQSKLPWLWATCTYYLDIIWNYISWACIWLWQHIVYYLYIAGTWLQENIFTGKLSGENLLKTLSWCLTSIQSGMHAALQWFSQMIGSTTSQN